MLSFGLNEFNNEPKDPEKEDILIFHSKMLKRLSALALLKLLTIAAISSYCLLEGGQGASLRVRSQWVHVRASSQETQGFGGP